MLITPQQARDFAERLSAKVIVGEDIQLLKKQERQNAEVAKLNTLEGFLDHKYGPWVRSDRSTWRKTLHMIKYNFASFLNLPLEDIQLWLIEQWRLDELHVGKAAATINRDVTRLRAALSKAVEWEILKTHPLSQLKPLKTEDGVIVRYLSKDEENRLRTALQVRETIIKKKRQNGNSWRLQRGYEPLPDFDAFSFTDFLQPMTLLAMNTGMRRGELFHLTWENINFQQSILTITGTTATSGKTRHIPLNMEAINVLETWKKQAKGNRLVFPGKDGNILDNVRKSWPVF